MKLFFAILILVALVAAGVFLVLFAFKKPINALRTVVAVVILTVVLVGIAVMIPVIKNLSDSKLQRMCGEWEAAEYLVEDGETYTGYLRLDINSPGMLTMYDGEAGNPGIEGFVMRTGDDKLLFIATNYAEMDTPPGWWDMFIIDTIEFEFDDADLMLRYIDIDEGASTVKFFAIKE